jgi:isoleucyl-tRNA synthetase
MKFKAGTRRRALEYEKDLVEYWKKHRTFEKSVDTRPKDNAYVFYDGPPFITGVPHHGTLLSSIVKDAVPRYWTMKGKRVERVWGWDCHGLPAEVFTEKKLGITDRRDIGTKISLEEYILTCRNNMVQTGDLWENTIDRIGRWVDFKGAYKTMDKNYMESVWWAFKTLYEKGKIYEGEKVLLYCTRDATPISKAEVAMDNSYQDVTDPSVYVKFKLVGENTSLLAWTTTPWTLPANTAVAVNEDYNYAEVEVGGESLILAEGLLAKVLQDEKHKPLEFKLIRVLKGSELVGKQYEPLFEDRGENAHKVWHADYVSLEDGTGLVHLAPAYGEEDYQLGKEKGFPIVSNIDANGFYMSGPWEGQYIWDANKPIAKQLHEQGVVWKIEYIRHSYPHCHRCGTKLMYRTHPSWFMDVDGQRTEMLEQNNNINWFPPHIKHGRFEKTVQSAPDWNMSRDRFWATAMPVWKGKDNNGKEYMKVVGSYAELKELSGRELEDYHRPWIDDVTFTIDGIEYKRIDKVLDCWFESGSMPFAQFHYPFENVEKFEQNFPGDFIAEYVGQVRAWFYYLHAVNVGLFGKNAFKNVIVTGTLAGNDGRKMSKSFGNYTDPNELMDQYSADSLRFLLLSSPVLNAEDYSLIDKDVADVARKLSMVWNMYDFFTMYAEVDGWQWNGELADPSEELQNPLDKWIVSRLHQLIEEVDAHMQRYDIPNALKPILPFVEDASNWYVRRSRRRFWKSGDDTDKNQAYQTLHYVLVQLAHVMAPFTPFLAEELYQKLTGGESVHLQDWPERGHVNELLIKDMNLLREAITVGLSERATAGIKVRQPLHKATVWNLLYGENDFLKSFYEEIVKEELNVKSVEFKRAADEKGMSSPNPSITLDLRITPELKREGLMREVIRNVQNARKQAGLNVDDRITLSLHADDSELSKALQEHKDTIAQETLAVSTAKKVTDAFTQEVKVEGMLLTITLARHA